MQILPSLKLISQAQSSLTKRRKKKKLRFKQLSKARRMLRPRRRMISSKRWPRQPRRGLRKLRMRILKPKVNI
jgi:hypothetical protein